MILFDVKRDGCVGRVRLLVDDERRRRREQRAKEPTYLPPAGRLAGTMGMGMGIAALLASQDGLTEHAYLDRWSDAICWAHP